MNATKARFIVSFLPYTESSDGTPLTNESFGHPKARGYGYGTLEEPFEREAEAVDRFRTLARSGHVERVEVRRTVPGQGQVTVPVCEWSEADSLDFDGDGR